MKYLICHNNYDYNSQEKDVDQFPSTSIKSWRLWKVTFPFPRGECGRGFRWNFPHFFVIIIREEENLILEIIDTN